MRALKRKVCTGWAFWYKEKKRKKGGISLFPASERSMHFNSSPLQVDLSPSPGPEREGKGIEREGGRQGGLLVRNGAWSRPSCSTERLLWTSSPLPHCCAKCGEGWRANLKQSKFLSFYTLVASLAFNRSQRSPKEAEVTGGSGGGRGRKEGESRGGTEEKTTVAQWFGNDA